MSSRNGSGKIMIECATSSPLSAFNGRRALVTVIALSVGCRPVPVVTTRCTGSFRRSPVALAVA